MTPKERFYATVRGEPRDRAPVTPIVMQWAADYIGRSYRGYYLDGDVLADAQIAVANALNTDWVSVMSDQWCESSSYGMDFDYPADGVGVPRNRVIESLDDAGRLPPLNLDDERPRGRPRCIEREVTEVGDAFPVCGWVEGPIAQYTALRALEVAMADLLNEPDAFHAAAEHLVAQAVRFARVQIDDGADVIGIGDAAASIVGPQLYHDLVLPWEQRLIRHHHDAGALVKLHICGDLKPILRDVVQTGADVIDLDWMVPVPLAREIAGREQTFAGNFDPAGVLLYGTPEPIADAARECLDAGGHRFMLQPGYEVPHGTPMDHMKAFCPPLAIE